MNFFSIFRAITPVVFIFFLCIGSGHAQHQQLRNGLSLKFLLIDYYAQAKNKPVYDFKNLTYGGEIGYFRNINSFVNIGFPLRVGVANLPQDTSFSDDIIFASLDAVLQLHLMKEDRLFNPYLTFGGGAFFDEDENISVHFPVGGGFNFRITDKLFFQAQTEYRHSLDVDRPHWHHSGGILFLTGGNTNKKENAKQPIDSDEDGVPDSKDDCPYAAGPVFLDGCPDSDGDGIPDKDDDCPTISGPQATKGCPDSDGDGIPDNLDDCPGEAGTVKGCPDSDGDGVPDKDDNCPNQAGSVAAGGCIDSDGDGVPDSMDRCPDLAGTANGCPDRDGDGVPDQDDDCPDEAGDLAGNGCPALSKEEEVVLEEAKSSVDFQPNKATLLPESYATLDKIAEMVMKRTNFVLRIHGHTDSAGNSNYNQSLSEARAKACYAYLLTRGVPADRMSYAGFGETQPVADNATPEGQRQNRRVEFLMIRK